MSKNRLTDAFKAIDTVRASQPNVQASRHSDALMLKRLDAKASGDYEKIRMSVYLQRATHRALKHAAIEEGHDMSEIIEILVSQWLQSKT